MIKKSTLALLLIFNFIFAYENLNEEIPEKIEFFYVDPNPTLAEEIIQEITHQDKLREYFFFFAALAKQHPHQIISWLSKANVDIKKNPSILKALQLGGLNGDALQLAQKANLPAKEFMPLANKTFPLLNAHIDIPGYVTCMCTHFSVSGDIRYIKKLIDLFEIKYPDVNLLTELQEEAKTRLFSLMFRHDKAYRLCLEEMHNKTGNAKAVLINLHEELQRLLAKNPFSESNGLFAGQLLITDDIDFEKAWENLPLESGSSTRFLTSISYPQENKKISIYLLMTGFDLSAGLDADLTYDLEIIGPDGTQMANLHKMEALKRKLPSRFFIQRSTQPITIELKVVDDEEAQENTVLAGSYKIKAVLRDNISSKTLNLSYNLEILPEIHQ